MDYHNSDSRIKIHHFLLQYIPSSEDLSLEPLIEVFKLVVVEQNELQKFFVNIKKIYWYFRLV